MTKNISYTLILTISVLASGCSFNQETDKEYQARKDNFYRSATNDTILSEKDVTQMEERFRYNFRGFTK